LTCDNDAGEFLLMFLNLITQTQVFNFQPGVPVGAPLGQFILT